MHVYAEINSH